MTTRLSRTGVKLATGVLAAVTAAALAGCGTDRASAEQTNAERSGPAGAVNDAQRVTGVRWIPDSLTVDGETLRRPASSPAYLTIEPGDGPDAGGASGGNTGCNALGADVRIDGDTLRVSDAVSTRMACRDSAFDAGLRALFTSDPTFEVSDAGGTLTLTGADGDTATLHRDDGRHATGTAGTDARTAAGSAAGDAGTAVAAAEPPVVGTRWVPQSVTVGGEERPWPAEAADAYLLVTEDGRAEGYSGCNWFDAVVELADGRFDVSDAGWTERACPDVQMEFEFYFTRVLVSDPAFEVTGDRLVLTADDGDAVTLVARS